MKKKLFTLLTLLVAVCSGAWADGATFTMADIFTGSNQSATVTTPAAATITTTATASNAKDGKLGSDGNYFQVVLTSNTFTAASLNGYINTTNTTKNWGFQFTTDGGTTWTSEETQANDGNKSAHDISVEVTIPSGANGFRVIRRAGTATYVFSITLTLAPTGPTIITQPVGGSYVQNSDATELSVTAEAVNNGTLSYQWYSNTTESTEGATLINGATNNTYTPSTASSGTTYYYCVVSESGVANTTTSDIVAVTVSAAEAPTISVSGAPANAIVVGTEVTLTATATGTPTPTVKWYDGNDTEVGTGAAYSPSTATAGTFTFYAVASNGVGTDATSAVQTIVVKEQVATPTISPNGAYFENSQEVTLACTTDGATIQYSTDGGSTWTDYTTALTFTETTTLKAKAVKDGYFNSEEATATFTKVTLVAQTDVTGLTEWDWGTVTNSSAVDFSNTALNNVDVLFANISNYGQTAVTAPDAFNQTALLMNGQRAYNNANGSRHCQVNYLKFNTTVAGIVTIEYANTGNNAARTVNVNGTKGSKSVTANTNYETETFDVTAGAVTIKGVQVSDDADKMLRIRKVTFQPTTTATVGAKGYATYCNSDYALDFSNKSIKAYTISSTDGQKLTLTNKNKVAKGEPVLLYSETANDSQTIPAIAESEATATDGNKLVAGTGAEITWSDTNKLYILYTGGDVPGFYAANHSVVAVGKAYLDLSGLATTARSFSFDLNEGETTGIAEMEALKNVENGKFYNLNGQQVAQPTKGMYIVNGKKYIIK